MILKKEVGGHKFKVIVRDATKQRLKDKCFRDQKKLAGNFSHWKNVEEVLGNSLVLESLLTHVSESQKGWVGNGRCCIDLSCTLGWESTDDAGKYQSDDLEEFFPSRSSRALRVKLNQTHLLAPKTSNVSISYEARFEGDFLVVVIHSMYPGVDIGKLNGDITGKTGRVFFDWDHPGA